jgi:hydrogenase maturation protease
MVSEEQVRKELEAIQVPGVGRTLGSLNAVREIKIEDDKVNVTISTAALSPIAQQLVKASTAKRLEAMPEVKSADVALVEIPTKELNNVKNIIAVMSGKGGVGKSLVAGMVAIALRKKGYEVGILDADITGPSIPKMFGMNSRPTGSSTGIMPVLSRTGIGVMSINLLLPAEDDAVIWRGPVIAKAITQFWEDVHWGNLDYLIVDLPPGTADVPLTVMQSFPINGVIIVFTPQDLTAMIVRKAVNMAHKMEKPVLGVFENMSYLYIPEIDKKVELFGKSRAEDMAAAAGAPLLGRMPVDPELVKLIDEGKIEDYKNPLLEELGEKIPEITAKQPAIRPEEEPKGCEQGTCEGCDSAGSCG